VTDDRSIEAGTDPTPSLAARLERLFDTLRRRDERPISNAAAAKAITEKTGYSISAAYLWQLRSGKSTNPTVEPLRAIAEFFGIAPSYLIDPEIDPKIEAQLELIQVLRDAGIRDLAMRASGLTPEAIGSLRAMVDHARQLEKLPPVESPEPEV